MTSFTVGKISERDGKVGSTASVEVVDVGTNLVISGFSYASISLTPAQTRELGFLLIKAAERHEVLVAQVKEIDQQRKDLESRQNSLMNELMQ